MAKEKMPFELQRPDANTPVTNATEIDYADIPLECGLVYDISVAHAVSNVPAQYESLSAALGSNGANIPQDVRRGGMAVKFINSASGKYEQWNLKASSWSTDTSNWGNTNVTQASEVVYNGQSLSDILPPLDNISKQNAQSEEQAIIYETDGGVQVGKIDANGADFTNLKRGGQQVARMTDLPTVPTISTDISADASSNTKTASPKAVKEYVDAHQIDLPISQETTQSENEEMEFGNDAGTQTYAKVGDYGIKSKAYLDMQGNNVIPTKDTSIGSTPSQTNVPTSKAVVDYVDAHSGGGDFPITKESATSDEEKMIFSADAGTQIYAEISSVGIKAKKFLDMQGNEIKTGGHRIKILCFGNSFTEDSMSYVPQILKNICPDLEFTIMAARIGGCPLVQHCVNLTGTPMPAPGDSSITYTVQEYYCSKFANDNSSWQTLSPMLINAALAYDDWDIITFQQAGLQSWQDWDVYFAPYIYTIHEEVFKRFGSKTIMLGWILTHGSYINTAEGQLDRWQKTMVNSKKIMDLTPTEILFPYGTAVQNLRSTPLNAAGVGGENLGFLADVAHIHEGIGCLTAAYCNALTILKAAGISNISIIGEPTRPTYQWTRDINVMSPHYGSDAEHPTVMGVSDDNCYTAQVAAILASTHPYEVINCNNFYTPTI